MFQVIAVNEQGERQLSAEILGEAFKVDYPTREAAQLAADHLTETASDFGLEGITYDVEGEDDAVSRMLDLRREVCPEAGDTFERSMWSVNNRLGRELAADEAEAIDRAIRNALAGQDWMNRDARNAARAAATAAADAIVRGGLAATFAAQFVRVFGGTATVEGDIVIACGEGWIEETAYRPSEAALAVLREAEPVDGADDPERADAAVCRALEATGALV